MSYNFNSIFTEVNYNETTETMEISFRDGSKYQYSGIGKNTMDGLVNADSKSRYYNANIRGKYAAVKI